MTHRLTKLAAIYLLLVLATTWAVAWGAAMLCKPDGEAGPGYLEVVPPHRLVTMNRLPGSIAAEVHLWAEESAVESVRQEKDSRIQLRELPGIVRAGAYPPKGIEKGVGGLAIEGRGWPSYALYCKLAPYYPFGSAQEHAFGAIVASDPSDPLYAATLLPYLPYWPGLLTDTLLYALLIATLHQLTTHTRRAHRHKRNRCPTCNYDLTGIDGPCPECGGER